jgi:hypothetical protein
MAKPIVFTEHAHQRMQDRGAREVDVLRAVELGQREPAQRGLHACRFDVEYGREWAGRHYAVQRIVALIDEEAERIVVVTVYTFYIAEGRAR